MIPMLVLHENYMKTSTLKFFHYQQIAKAKSYVRLQNKFAFTGHLHFLYLKFSLLKNSYIDIVFNNTQHTVLFQLSLGSPVTLYFKQLNSLRNEW